MSRSQHLISGNPQQPIMIRSGAQDLMMTDDNPKYIDDWGRQQTKMIHNDAQELIIYNGLGDDQDFTGERNVIHNGAQELRMYNCLGHDQYFTGGDATCIDFVDQYRINKIQQDMGMTNNVQEYLIDHGGAQEMNVINGGESDYAYLETLPIGYRFKPDDTELIYCLRKKVNNEPLPTDKIYTVNLYDFGPHNLAEYFGVKGEDDLYIITPLKVKNKRSKYADTTTPNRCWKATSGEIPIIRGGIEVGSPKTFKNRLDYA